MLFFFKGGIILGRRTKKKQAFDARTILVISGLFFILFGLLAIFRVGFLGILVANVLRILFGNMYLLLASLLLLYGGYLLLFQREPTFENRHFIYGLIFFVFGLVLCSTTYYSQDFDENGRTHMIQIIWNQLTSDLSYNMVSKNLAGGLLGAILYEALHFLVAQVGTYIVSFLALAFGVMQMLQLNLAKVADFLLAAGQSLVQYGDHLRERQKDWQEAKEAERERRQQEKNEQRLAAEEAEHWAKEQPTTPTEPADDLAWLDDFNLADEVDEEEDFEEVALDLPKADSEPTSISIPTASSNLEVGSYQLPSSKLLQVAKKTDQSSERKLVEQKKKVLAKTFASFAVDARVEAAHIGPAITKFEIKLAEGVKVNKIVNLADDLALALAAKDVRIEAPIPGKSLIGIEVPNQTTSMVSAREIIESHGIQREKLLEVPLGKDISGEVVSCNLAEMPHLLIAGSTGSGKSVCINDIIISLLMQAKPNEVKLLMVDPKMVELSVYNDIPHLLTPVVTNPRKASQALHKVVEEMERRYDYFAQEGVRNIKGYNAHHEAEKMPYIVVIVDELADLMMVASKEVEDSIIRLAQKARAAGIHMILATQRPSVDVITGIIKANVPSRIAFAVSSGTDSRTILDSNGAEKLLGKGDMLYRPIGENKAVRVQGAFISDAEVEAVIGFIRSQAGPAYDDAMLPQEVETAEVEAEVHPRFQEAVDIVKKEQKASASMLQRRLHVGYNAAANMIEEMENRGFIGPSQGSKPREVYIKEEESRE